MDHAICWMLTGFGGYITVFKFFWIIVWALLIWICIAIARRPATNTKCVLGLAMVFASFEAGQLLSFWDTAHAGFFAILLKLAVIFGFGLLGVFLAALGLLEYRRAKGKYSQGKGQAILAIVLCIVVWGIVGLKVKNDHDERAGLPKGTKSLFSVPGEEVVFEDLNFRFESLPKPWVKFDPKLLNEESCLAFLRNNPQIYFTVIAEKLGIEAGYSLEDLLELVAANADSVATEKRVLNQHPVSVNGLDGIRLEEELLIQGKWFSFQRWIGCTNGFVYQLNCWGYREESEVVRESADEIFKRFSLLDPDRVFRLQETSSIQDKESTAYAYSTGLKDLGWTVWGDMDEDFPEADFGALKGRLNALAVVPVHLLGTEPPPEAMDRGLMAFMDIKPDDAELTLIGEVDRGAVRGRKYTYHRVGKQGPVRFVFQTLGGNGYAYLAAAWGTGEGEDWLEALENGLSKISFRPSGLPPDVDDYTQRERQVHGTFFNQIGLYYWENEDYDRAVPWFKRALAVRPDYMTYLTNCVRSLSEQNLFREALDLLNQHISRFPENREMESWLAFLKMKLGLNQEALVIYAALFDSEYREDSDFKCYIDLLVDEERYDQALTALDRYLPGTEELSLHLLRASVRYAMGDYDTAVTTLQALQAGRPFNFDIAWALDDNFYAAGRYNESIEICDEIVAEGSESAYAYYRKGRSAFELKWYRMAKDCFEEAFRRDSKNEEFKDFLDHVSGLLGEGSNYNVKKPIEAVHPPEAWAQPGGTLADDGPTGYGAEFLLRSKAVFFKKGSDYRITSHRRIRIMDQGGVRRFSTLEFSFDPLEDEIFVNRLVVYDEGGKEISRGDVNAYFVIDDTSSGTATHDKKLNVPVAGLRLGCILEYVYTVAKLNPPSSFPIMEHNMFSDLPVACSRLCILGEVGQLRHRASEGILRLDSESGICWSMESPPVYKWEPFAEVYQRYMPMVWVNDRDAVWEEEGKSYIEEIQDKLEPSGDLGDLVEDLVRDRKDEDGVIEALSRFVMREITYKAIEFGRSAWIPRPVGKILRDRYGDCKDHALLLCHLLKAAGLDGHLALVNTNGPVMEDFPSIDSFNHMITAIPVDGGRIRFVDCTDKTTDPLLNPPYGLAEGLALVLDPDRPRLVRMPGYTQDSNLVRSERRIDLIDDSLSAVHETLELHGYYASFVRQKLLDQEPAFREETVREMLTPNCAGLYITEMKVENIDDLEKPLFIQMAYSAGPVFHEVEGRLIGRILDPWERYFLNVRPVGDRGSPFRILFPCVVKSAVTINAPDGFEMGDLSGFAGEGESHFLKWKVDAENDQMQGTVHFEAAKRVGVFPASDYRVFREQSEQLLLTFERQIILRHRNR